MAEDKKDGKLLITLSREYGSGGRDIAHKLGEELGIPCYDHELINKAVEESGIALEEVIKDSEQISNPLAYLFSFAGGPTSGDAISLPGPDRIFLAQSKVIKDFADQGSCIVVGHCADYILENRDPINVFIHGEYDSKIKRIMARSGLDEAGAKARMKKYDKGRANYYQHYTDRKWGLAVNYDLSVSSTDLGIDGTVALIKSYLSILGKC